MINPIPRLDGNPLIPYTQTQLPGGLTLVHKEVRTAPIVAMDIWVRTGAVDDPEPNLGLSHFYEHMFFKGTERYGVGAMDRLITSLGGYNNAATSLDYTHYFVVLPSPGWRSALDVLVDTLFHPLFPPEEIERERSVILEEIKRHEDNPWSKIYDEFLSTTFSNCRYRRNVLGTEESLRTITRDSFTHYHRDRYHPSRITFCVVGDISLVEVEAELNQQLEKKEPADFDTLSSVSDLQPGSSLWETIQIPGEISLSREVNQAYLLIGFPTPQITATPPEYALDLLSSVLGDGRSSRLYRRLNDELGIVSSINCSFFTLAHAGLFLIEAVTDHSKLNQVEAEIEKILSLVRQSLTPEELVKTKSMSRADFAFSNEKVISIAHTYGYGRCVATIEDAVRYQERLETVMVDDIDKAMQTFLIPSRRCRGVLIPNSG